MPRTTDMSNSEIMTPDDVESFVQDSEQSVQVCEAAGKSDMANIHRVRTAIVLWSLADQHAGTEHEDFLIRQAASWSKAQLPALDAVAFGEQMQQRTLPREQADQQAAATEDDADESLADEVVANATIPTEPLDGLKGDELQAALEDVIERILLGLRLEDHPAFDEQTIGNFLFTGEPGTGKTTAAQAVATELRDRGYDFTFLPLKGTHLKSHLYGQSQQIVEATLDWADANGPTLVFIDEFDEIATRDDHEETRGMANELLSSLDGTDSYENIVLIGATNRRDELADAMVNRFAKEVTFTEPPTEVKPDILLENIVGDGVVADFDRDELTELDFGDLVGRDLVNAAPEAIVHADSGELPIQVTIEDVRTALSAVRQKEQSN